jgi:phosphoribosyl 1,2-cyclic phosphodiesterase
LKVHILASGSSANAVLVETPGGSVLVDCGLSGAEAVRRMESTGFPPENLDAILVSHEHTDHVQGVGVLARRYDVPVYITPATLEACHERKKAFGDRVRTVPFVREREFFIRGLLVRAFYVNHDAADPVGFTFRHGRFKAGIATDMGSVNELVVRRLSSCQLLVIESNHDPGMLRNGPYPWSLKDRIKSNRGHLANEDAAKLLERVVHEELEGLAMAHISETNNCPDLVRTTAEDVLRRCGLADRVSLNVADQRNVVTMTARGREPVCSADPCGS